MKQIESSSLEEYLEARALSVLGLMPAPNPTEEAKFAFTNDMTEIRKQKVALAVAWYSGESDELLRVYNYNARIEFRTEYYYYENDRSYFWSIAALEKETKRTHSGFGKAIIDTIVDICGVPVADAGKGPDGVSPAVLGKDLSGMDVFAQKALDDLLHANMFWDLYQNKQMPLTLVEGYGAYKITWDKAVFGCDPVITYYRANDVRIYERCNRVLGMTFLDYYRDGKGQRYLVAETRVLERGGQSATFITECFKEYGQQLIAVHGDECDFLPVKMGVQTGMPCLFAQPCRFYHDHTTMSFGKGVLDSKFDVLDGLDQTLSILENTVRVATPLVTFDTNFADRDEHGMPKLPNLYNQNFIQIRGRKNEFGSEAGGSKPIEVTQPQIDVDRFVRAIEQYERLMINGILSPATMGLDVNKQDSKGALEEKDKTTVFTRNHVLEREKDILEGLIKQALLAKQYLLMGKVDAFWLKPTVEFDEFSDTSYESKIESLSSVLANNAISPKMYVKKVYGNSLDDKGRDEETKWLDEQKQKGQLQAQDEMFGGDEEGSGEGGQEDLGAVLGGDA